MKMWKISDLQFRYDAVNNYLISDKYGKHFPLFLQKLVDKEFQSIIQLRKLNKEKYEKDCGESIYCVCNSNFGSFMIRCELCLDWFHPTCVPLPKFEEDQEELETSFASSQAQTAYKISMRQICYICPCCCRSKRPKYDELLPLLRSLSKLPLRLMESEAFRCLTER